MEDSDLLASVKKTDVLATECSPIEVLCINQIFFCVCKYLLNAYICCHAVIRKHPATHVSRALHGEGILRSAPGSSHAAISAF